MTPFPYLQFRNTTTYGRPWHIQIFHDPSVVSPKTPCKQRRAARTRGADSPSRCRLVPQKFTHGPGYVETGGIFRSISLVTWYSKYVYSFVTSTGGYGADDHHWAILCQHMKCLRYREATLHHPRFNPWQNLMRTFSTSSDSNKNPTSQNLKATKVLLEFWNPEGLPC